MSTAERMRLALAEAEKDCRTRGSFVVITLRSGKELTGKIDLRRYDAAVHIQTWYRGFESGWATVDIAEIAAIESRAPENLHPLSEAP